MSTGALTFARFAWPPNLLGYCGPSGETLFEALATGASAPAASVAPGFAGAWPYLEVIAASAGIEDPLDRRVVEAYWIGNELLGRIDTSRMGLDLESRFRAPTGRAWDRVAATIGHGAVPHHAFHVFVVYPWAGMLKSGPAEPALDVLTRCSIRTGRVAVIDGERALVTARSLTWDGHRFADGAETDDWYRIGADGVVTSEVSVGDRVAVHWDWVCERLDRMRERRLVRWTDHARRLAETVLEGMPLSGTTHGAHQ